MRILLSLFSAALIVAIAAGAVGLVLLHRFGQDLPDYSQLANYEPPVVTRVHANDGRLLSEFATERRVFVPIEAMPRHVIQAFLSAEDKNFYSHPGIDPTGIARAVFVNAQNLFTGRRPVGGSTITQQVAKNFLLSSEVSVERKLQEAILAFRIERAFDKDQILELYLNEIYLGYGSYGVAAAALNYFNKSLDELTVDEAAYLAALPKAPNNYHPVRQTDAAIERRNWVLSRMVDDGYLSEELRLTYREAPLMVQPPDRIETVTAGYFTEEVRRQLARLYGEAGLYGGGLSVRTTLDPELQQYAVDALRKGLTDYDRRHGWRGPVAHFEAMDDWPGQLADLDLPDLDSEWRPGTVLEVEGAGVELGFQDRSRGYIPFSEMQWARPWLEGQRVGAEPSSPAAVLEIGDVVYAELIDAETDADANAGGEQADEGEAEIPRYALRQIPDVEGAIVAIDPHTGRVLAMSGGFDHNLSEFNRATQALRQTGSSFKPFVYLAALENGFTPSSILLDGPMVIEQGPGLAQWRPSNYSNEFYGPTSLRVGLEQSRNLVTVRLAQYVGMDKVADVARRFGVIEDMPPHLAMSLGSGETTLMQMTKAFAQFVNGGRKIEHSLIDRIQDRHGTTIYRHDERVCDRCRAVAYDGGRPPVLPDEREQVTDPRVAYQIVSILEGAVQRGTGRRLTSLDRPIAGKTGTTNEARDAWFVGFSPDLAVGAYVGFDDPSPLGPRETGASVAAPVFESFMAEALAGQPATPFRIPPNVRMIRVDPGTGNAVPPGTSNFIWEAFLPGSSPGTDDRPEGSSSIQAVGEFGSDGGSGNGGASSSSPSTSTGTGGLY